MMSFKANGKTYKAKVSYSDEDSQRPVKGKFVPVKVTTIEVAEVLDDGTMDFFANGYSICMPEDNFNKAKGRYLASKDAIKFAYMTGSVEPSQDFAKAMLKMFPNPDIQ